MNTMAEAEIAHTNPSTLTLLLGLLLVVMLASGGAELAALIRLANLWLNGRRFDQRSVAVGSDLSFIS